MFDSHVATLLDVAVALVNALTDGARHGRPYRAPDGRNLLAAVRAAVPAEGTPPNAVTRHHAAYLARSAQRMRAVFEAADREDLDEAAAALNALLLSAGTRPQLDRVGDGPWQLHFHGSDDSVGVGWSAGCAAALALALGSDLAGRLGVCRADQCDRVFVDTSRNAGRQFCSTACQNRVKAAAFRARQAGRR